MERRRADDPNPDDPLRGLYLTDEHLDWVFATTQDLRVLPGDDEEEAELAEVERQADNAEVDGHILRLRQLSASFGLTEVDVELLLTTVAPDVDSRFERLYGYLNDDVSRRRPTIGLALELAGASPFDAAARARLSGGGPLIDQHLIVVEQDDLPFLSRILRVPDRVTAYLLGDDTPDGAVVGLLTEAEPFAVDGGSLARALQDGASLIYLIEEPGAAALSFAVDGLRQAGRGALVLDLTLLAHQAVPSDLVQAASREARLVGAGLVAGPVEALMDAAPAALRVLADLPGPVVLIGRRGWDPMWSASVPAVGKAGSLGREARAALWREVSAQEEAGAAVHFQLSPEAVNRSVRAARLMASIEGADLTKEHLLAGARSQNAAGLERHARRVAPSVDWDDLVVRPTVLSQLEELAARAANRDRVLDDWGMRPGGGRGRGITGLFAGDPGTGKTMAAEVVAGALGLDLYTVDLSTVVDKYIGETEKHLERIFSEAEGVNGVILFDEADALFGKRSEVSDAKDRHANIEVAYLLQRMERFDGLAILATNLSSNIDEAFARRLDAIVEFPMPDEEERLLLWQHCLGRSVPRDDDLDLAFCAHKFELSGGNIRSIVLTAAYLAAALQQPVSMEMLMRAVEREYRKLGRLVLESEFGPWYKLVRSG